MLLNKGAKGIHLKYIFKFLFFKVVLDTIYVYWVYPIFGYSGYSLAINYFNIFISYFLLVIMVLSVPKGDSKLSYMILNMHLVIIYIPLLTLLGFGGTSFIFALLAVFCFLIQSIAIRLIPTIRINKIKRDRFSGFLVNCLLLSFTVINYLYLFNFYKLNLNVFNFNNIYDIRSYIRLEGIFSYLITWQYRIINPYIIVYAHAKKSKEVFIVSVLLQIIIFFYLPYKEILLSLALVFIILILEKLRISFSEYFVHILSIIGITSVMIIEFCSLMPFALVTRLLFEPAKIKYQYFAFFNTHPKLLYSEGLIGKVLNLKYPYSQPIGFIVYSYFEPLGTSNSNTGYIAYAYANSGVLGMLMMSFLFIIILLLIDSFSISKNKLYLLSVFIYPMIILNDGDLLTLLLTGGLFLLIFLLFLHNTIDRSDDCHKGEKI